MGETGGTDGTLTITYCVVPFELAAKLHEPLRQHFAEDAAVEVVVERRGHDRRRAEDRRAAPAARDDDRRLIRNQAGRRIGDRRAPLVAVDTPALPRKARAHAARITFVERVELSDEQLVDLDSARLVTRFQAGDQEAFTLLYLRYFDRVYGYLRTIFREGPHEVEDLTQQVFVRAFEALPRYQRRGQPFRAWLFTVARNLARTHVVKRGRGEVPFEPSWVAEKRDQEPAEEPPPNLEWVTDRELVMFVERLPIAQRQVLVLKFMLDLRAKEIGQILNRSTDDVRMLEHRALRFLEQRLTAIGRHSGQERERPMRVNGRIGWMRVLRSRKGAIQYNPRRVGVH